MEKKKFRLIAEVTVTCERVVEADDLEDAESQAEATNADEWLSWATGETVEVEFVGPERPKKGK